MGSPRPIASLRFQALIKLLLSGVSSGPGGAPPWPSRLEKANGVSVSTIDEGFKDYMAFAAALEHAQDFMAARLARSQAAGGS